MSDARLNLLLRAIIGSHQREAKVRHYERTERAKLFKQVRQAEVDEVDGGGNGDSD
jgi:hypothetical protein